MLSVSGREVPITPSGSIMWESSDAAIGMLYLPAENTEHNAKVAALLQSGAVGRLINMGKSGGKVYESPGDLMPGVVVKEFTPRIIGNVDVADRGALPELRANVMFAAGLNLLDQRRGPWQIRGAEVLGALVMHNSCDENVSIHARWIITKIEKYPGYNEASWYMPITLLKEYIDRHGKHITKYAGVSKPPWKPSLPSPNKRHKLYTAAVNCANGKSPSGLVINFDDHPINMLLERIPILDGRRIVSQGRVVKLDVQPLAGFEF